MEKKNNWKAWIYLSPAIILMAVLTFFPLINTLIVSFMSSYTNYSAGLGTGFTLNNYGRILGILSPDPSNPAAKDTQFFSFTGPSALSNTLLIVVITVPISILLALVIAICLNNIKWLRNFLQTIFFLPYVTNVIAIGMVFSIIFQPTGVFNKIFNLTIPWISDSVSTWFTCMFVLCLYIIWNALPYKILIFMSGLQGIDKQYYDAARIDGASRIKREIHITIPLLSPQILYIAITSFIGAFKEYNAVIGLLNRNYSHDRLTPDMYTVVYYIYDKIGSITDPGLGFQLGSAAAAILFVIIMIVTLIQMKVSEKKVVY